MSRPNSAFTRMMGCDIRGISAFTRVGTRYGVPHIAIPGLVS
jgi:hypothetical protein